MTNTMKAYYIEELGEMPKLMDREIPEPKAGEVLVKMAAAAGLCCFDLEVIQWMQFPCCHGVAVCWAMKMLDMCT